MYKNKSEQWKKWHEENKKSKELKQRKNNQLKRSHGITEEQYNEILKKQHDKCSICGRKNNGDRLLSVDHNHETREIRGLLCGKCNFGLGYFNDDIKLLKKSIKYLNQKTFNNLIWNGKLRKPAK